MSITSTCENDPICNKSQLAICLHCQRRLCLEHITEHNNILHNNLSNISKDIQTTYQQIQIESKKRQKFYDQILLSLNQWHRNENDKLQHIYEQYLTSIQSQHEIIKNEERKFFQQLEQNAIKPLEYLRTQQNIDIEMIQKIQQIIQKIQKENTRLKLDIIMPDTSSFSIPSNNHFEQPTKKRKNASEKPADDSLKRMIMMFSNISYVEQTKQGIRAYAKKQNDCFNFPNFICSYLIAWYRKTKIHTNLRRLNEYISIIQELLSYRKDIYDVLYGIQEFFSQQNIKEDKSEIMALLLEFFLDNQCFDKTILFKWYNDIESCDYQGLYETKQLAKPFIQSLLSSPTIENVQTVSTSSNQPFSFEIKQEQNSDEII